MKSLKSIYRLCLSVPGSVPLLIFFALPVLGGCAKPLPSQSEFVLATVCSITLYEKGRPDVYREIFDRLGEIERRMSVYVEESDVYALNKAAGVEPVAVHPEVFAVIEKALAYAELSDGAFDPTVQPLVALWGIGGDAPEVPAPEKINEILPLIDYRDVEIDRDSLTVFLKKPGMALDLGAIAKGFAADEAAAIIRKRGIPRAIVDLGGNILTVGQKADKTPWRVGIQNPLENRGAYTGVAQIGEKTVVTSGVYERFFESDGVRYHHLFSPSTGYPARNNLLSVSIITDSSMDADALSTSVFVLGYERGRALVESLKGTGAIFVFEDRSIRVTKGVDFTLTDTGYRIEAD